MEAGMSIISNITWSGA